MLSDLGIRPRLPTDGHPAFAAWLHLVRRIRANDALRVIGLVPASDGVSGTAVGVQLGVALTHASGLDVMVLDFNTVQPAWSRMDLPETAGGRSVALFSGVSVMRIVQPTPRNEWQWVKERLAEQTALNRYILCDMTGLQQLRQLDEGLALVEGAISLVCPGKVWEWQLTRLHKRFGSKDLGVLFVDPG